MKLIPSPCKNICRLRDGICIGCKRTKEEIATWSKLTNDQKKAIMDRINQSNNQ